MKKHERAKKVEECIRIVWSSLESHLDGAYTKTPEGQKFHISCVKEYAELLRILSELY